MARRKRRRRRRVLSTAACHPPARAHPRTRLRGRSDGRPVVHHRIVDTLGSCCAPAPSPGHARRGARLSGEVHDRPVRRRPCMPIDATARWRRSSGSHRRAGRPTTSRRRGDGRARRPRKSGRRCVWHVVGLQRSIREWSMRQGWGGRPMRSEQAHGVLVAALGVLAGWYGYEAHGAVVVDRIGVQLMLLEGSCHCGAVHFSVEV